MSKDTNPAMRRAAVRQGIEKAATFALDKIILPSVSVRRGLRFRLRRLATEGWMAGYDVGKKNAMSRCAGEARHRANLSSNVTPKDLVDFAEWAEAEAWKS